uniref:Uncharacterized protein n=1 Tax=Schistocephalus solidus TaxID=70667 RepID=A0A0X3Q0N1_SCHSO
MDQYNGPLSDPLSRLTKESAPLKRKFAPNLSKALAKKTIADVPKSGPKPKKPKDEVGVDGTGSSKIGHRGRINRRALEDDEPRFVQSYSIFEKGIGCVVKADSNVAELRAIGGETSRTSVSELASTELKPDPVLQAESFVKDIRQCFKDAPVSVMQDTSDSLTLSVSAEPTKRSAQVPTQLFDETSAIGSLFTLQLPESLLAEVSLFISSLHFPSSGYIKILLSCVWYNIFEVEVLTYLSFGFHWYFRTPSHCP